MKFNSELIKKLSDCFSPSGRENRINKVIENEIKNYVDEVYTDVLGNLIAHKKGSGKKIMFAAHMDQIGLIITYIESEGFLRFSNIGFNNPYMLLGHRIIFENGVHGIINCEKLQDYSKLTMDKLYIDIGALTKKDAEKAVKIGDMCIYKTEFYENDNIVMCKALDDRVGCFVLIEAIKAQVESDCDIYYVFTVQEELGLRGSKTAAYGINPDIGIAVDITDTGDTPNYRKMAVKLGNGAAIKIKDNSQICSPFIVDLLTKTAEENNIKYQYEILEFGGTDSSAIQLSHSGIPSGTISVPSRYFHSSSEVCEKSDILNCIKLVKAVIKK